MTNPNELSHPLDDETLASCIDVPDFNQAQLAFFRALLRVNEKERLALRLNPTDHTKFDLAHTELVGKEEQLKWILEAHETLRIARITKDPNYQDPFSPFGESATMKSLDVQEENSILLSLNEE